MSNATTGERVADKVVIVSGGARGMGAAHATALVAQGARVVITDVREEQGHEFAASLGDQARFMRADVTKAEDWARAVELARSCYGEIHGLINNAGVLDTGTAESTTIEQYRRVIDILQFGVFLGMQAVIPSMRLNGGGSIVNISSTAGVVGFPDYFAYTAAKFAVTGMTKAAALDLAPQIRVNSIHPGDIETPMTAGFIEAGSIPPAGTVPLGRYGRPSEVAAMALFLISDESSYVTGAEMVVDGGYTVQ